MPVRAERWPKLPTIQVGVPLQQGYLCLGLPFLPASDGWCDLRDEIDLRSPWGKLGGGDLPHPLICHAIDTMAVAELLFDKLISPRLRSKFVAAFTPIGEARAWVAFFCGLHDLGKLSPAFQAVRADAAVRLMGEPAAGAIRQMPDYKRVGRIDTPHGVLTAVRVGPMLRAWGADLRTAQDLANAIGGHHGFFLRSETLREARNGFRDQGDDLWKGWCVRLAEQLLHLRELPKPSEAAWAQLHVETDLLVVLSGLTSVSDWIASDERNFPYAGADVDLDAYVQRAAERAHEAVSRLGWISWEPPEEGRYKNLFGEEPRQMQLDVEQLTYELGGPLMLVVEAPTGEGKTKAALQAGARLARSRRTLGPGAGLYFATPTRATSNQAYCELSDFIGRHQPELAVRLLHSGAEDFLIAQRVRAQEDEVLQPSAVDEGGDPAVAVDARDWFTRKKGLLAPIAVGTVDQVLMAGIRSRHVFVRMTGLSGKVVVIDEVHAYDPYMSTMLDRVLQWLGFLGVSVILLSATLPAHRRADLVRRWQSELLGHDVTAPAPDVTVGYPRITYATAETSETIPTAVSDLNADRRMTVLKVPDEELVNWLLEQVRPGGCVAVIHNLVRRVANTQEALEEAISRLPEEERPRLYVITGQLSAKARNEVENELRLAFGPPPREDPPDSSRMEQRGDAARPPRAIVVGTQVLESSLDLDFDLLVSDLAPIDCLIQRMGRVHRHGDAHLRPAHMAKLTLAITGIEETGKGPKLPPYTGSIYPKAVMWRTWALLRDRAEIHSPGDVSELIEKVYGPQPVACPSGWMDLDEAAQTLQKSHASQRFDARVIYLPWPRRDMPLTDMTKRAGSSRQTRREGRPT
ncbi:CRISPR-associated helicase Cas3' [Sphaerimonospora cavernae]|uniref:CRISPR-associated helicase Cas3 n=1 Tax=Sphaerimonospora cavernae TaxID=1740611 RepID=A0ABV6U1U8_9ACTN